MADQKVSDLPSLNGASVDPADLLYIVDSSAGTAGSKKITMGQFDIYTAAVAQTLTNKTISGASNTLTNISLSTSVTGTLPVANGGTGVTTSTGTGSTVLSTSPTLVTPALGTPTALVGTNITGTATAFNINGTVGATTPAAGAFTTLSASSSVTLSGGTANGVLYLNGSKVATSGSALTWNGSTLLVGGNTRFGSGAVIPGFATASDVSLANNASLRGTNAVGSSAFELIKFNTSDQVVINNDGADAVLTGAATFHRWAVGGGEQMRLDSNGLEVKQSQLIGYSSYAGIGTNGLAVAGNVGIGTSSPWAKLSLATTNGQFGIANGNTSGGVKLQAWNAAGNADGYLAIEGYTKEYARFDSSGNLGIGTSSPDASFKLTVSGNSAGVGPGVLFPDSAGSPTNYALYTNGSKNFVLRNQAGGGVTGDIWTATPAGNLGLGVTPSAWNSDYKAIQVGANGSIAGRVGTSNTFDITTNAFRDTAGNWQYIATNPAARFTVDGSVGGFQWYIAPSGTAGNAITGANAFVQVMTLSSDGTFRVKGAGTAGSTDAVQFSGSAPADAMRLTSGGDLLVGTTDAAINSGTGVKLKAGANNNINAVGSDSTDTTSNYNLYSTGAAAYRFYVGMGGTIYATSTTITAISDQRLKENIRDLDAGLSEVMALKPRKFDWKAGKGKDKKGDRGWIAQEFEQVFPDMVDTWQDPAPEGEEPYKAVNADLIPVLVKAMQEQQALITDLRARVAALESTP